MERRRFTSVALASGNSIKLMRPITVLSTLLTIAGGFLLLVALVSCGASILSLIERARHGPGLLFADVEVFGFIAFVSGIAGLAAIVIARKLSKKQQTKVS